MCPKAPATSVVIHRIEFQESEREILRDVAMAYQINKVADPFVRLINDNTTMLLILSAAAAWLGFTYLPPKIEEGVNVIVDFKEQLDHAIEQGSIVRERAGQVRDFAVWNAPGPLGPTYRGIDYLERLLGIDLFDFGAGFEPS